MCYFNYFCFFEITPPRGVFMKPCRTRALSHALLTLQVSNPSSGESNFLPGNGYARISLNSLFWYNVLMLIKQILTLQEHSLLRELEQPRGLCWDNSAWSEMWTFLGDVYGWAAVLGYSYTWQIRNEKKEKFSSLLVPSFQCTEKRGENTVFYLRGSSRF